jgi:hypothetical protein
MRDPQLILLGIFLHYAQLLISRVVGAAFLVLRLIDQIRQHCQLLTIQRVPWLLPRTQILKGLPESGVDRLPV